MCRTASARRPGRYFSLANPPGPFGPKASQFKPVDPAQFLPARLLRCEHLTSAGMSTPIRPNGMRATCVQRLNATYSLPVPSEPVAGPFWRPKSPLFAGRQALIPLPLAGLAECCFADPLGECRRDANTLAPNGPKARTLRCARQELVRVPESNTKYGGQWGITGGKPAPVLEASISESSGIRNQKNLHPVTIRSLPPALHRAGIFLGTGVAQTGLT
jgi:hypothetical protein